MKWSPLAGAVLALAICNPAQAVGGMADVSVIERATGRALPVHWHRGEAYVVGRPGAEYRILVRNRDGGDVLAVMSVDGVNVITGETADPRQSGYVIGARGRLAVDGWRKSLSRTAAFFFTALDNSYAARTGRPDDAGVIGVALFRRKAEPPAALSDLAPPSGARQRSAPRPAEDAASAEPLLGTGHGRNETSYARRVTFERATEQPAETIAIRYDSYRNLVAMGVLRPVTRHPRPFPGFVPDA